MHQQHWPTDNHILAGTPRLPGWAELPSNAGVRNARCVLVETAAERAQAPRMACDAHASVQMSIGPYSRVIQSTLTLTEEIQLALAVPNALFEANGCCCWGQR